MIPSIKNNGHANILIGAPGADPDGKENAGETYLIYGNTKTNISGVLEPAKLDMEQCVLIKGQNAGGSSGVSVSSAGDIDNDGYADILVGAPGADAGGTYLIQFNLNYVMGKEIPPPPGIGEFPEGGPKTDPEAMTFWHNKKLYALRKGPCTITWEDKNGNIFAEIDATFVWDDKDYQIHVADTPAVNLTPQGSEYNWVILPETNPKAGVSISSGVFSASGAGFSLETDTGNSLLMFSSDEKPNPNTEKISFKTVKTIRWDNPNYLGEDVAIFGEEILDTNYHNTDCGSPWVLSTDAKYSTEVYDRDTHTGRIFPIYEKSKTAEDEQKMVVVYYEKDNYDIDWPYKPVHYNLKWTETPQIHVATVKVDANPNFPPDFLYINIKYTDDNTLLKEGPINSGDGSHPQFFSPAGPGLSLLMFCNDAVPTPETEKIFFKTVKTVNYNHSEHLDDVDINVGDEILDANYHGSDCDSPLIFFPDSRYCKKVYHRPPKEHYDRIGRIFPTDENGDRDDQKMVVVYYQKDELGIQWPYQPVRYEPKWSVDQIHVAEVAVKLAHPDYGYIEVEKKVNTDAQVQDKIFTVTQVVEPGLSLLMFSQFKPEPSDVKGKLITFKTVRTLEWNGSPSEGYPPEEHLVDNVPTVIGKEILDTSLHDTACGPPLVFFESSRYCTDVYLRKNHHDREGRVFPIDVNGPGEEQKMVVVYYQKDNLGIDWPYKPVRYIPEWLVEQIHVAESPAVHLNEFGWKEIQRTEAGAIITTEGFEASGTGRTLLSLSRGDKPTPGNPDGIIFKTVKTVRWNNPEHLGHADAPIGEEVLDPELHNIDCGSPFVFLGGHYVADNPDSMGDFNHPGYYNREARTGPIIPVNRKREVESNENRLVVFYYQKDDLDIDWPYKPVLHYPDWPAEPDNIVLASGAGSGELTWRKESIDIYRQPEPNLPGYNPNEEHALTASSVAYALRNDLGNPDTSEPYVLVKYQDNEDNWRIKVYQVVAEQPSLGPEYTTDHMRQV